jgi:uncharacterized delta-60 repeat protein
MTRPALVPVKFTMLVAALALVVALPATTASAAPGQIDPTFGHLSNGTVFADHARSDLVNKVLHQPDGKIVTVATALSANLTSTMWVTRYLANGSLDPSFGHGGIFTRVMNGTGSAWDGVLQPDGKIVVVGWTDPPADFFVMRLLANGTVDPSFVTAHPTTNFGGNHDTVDQAFSVALAPGGKIVVAGRSGGNVALARYTPTGALDPSFSGDGLTTHDFGGQSDAEDVAVLPGGRIIISGVEGFLNGSPRVLVARFNVNGTLDTTFGTGGRVNPTGTRLQSVQALLLQGTKPVVAGVVDEANAGITRYNANGTLDATFGSAGTRLAHVGKFTRVTSLAADAAGRIVAAGEAGYSSDFPGVPTFTALFRYSANGRPDPAFGCAGMVLTEMLGNGAGVTYNASAALTVATAGNDIIVGGSAVSFNGSDFPPTDGLVARYDGAGSASGYAVLRGDGGTSAFGGAPACGSTAGLALNAPIVGGAFDPAAAGNWTVATDGGIFTFGAARFHGSTGAIHLNQPIVGMAAAPDGNGYWLVARDGGVFSFGSARFHGSTGNIHLNQPVVGMAATRDGKGYWLVARDGGIFAFGSAHFSGSTGAIHLNQPVVGMAADRDGRGYWLAASDGGVFAFDAHFSGSTGAIHLAQPVVGIAADPDGRGYWMAARDGGVFSFDARFGGSTGGTPVPVGSPRSTVGIAAAPLPPI